MGVAAKSRMVCLIMDYLIAFVSWGSVFMIIYACGHICDVIAMKLKLYETSVYFWFIGLAGGFFLIGSRDFAGNPNMGWVEEHVLAFELVFSTWWLALLALIGWGSAIWRITNKLLSDLIAKRTEKQGVFAREAPPGLYRVVGYDMFDYSTFFVSDHYFLRMALQKLKQETAEPQGIPASFSNQYYIHDENKCLFRGCYDDGITPNEQDK